jgi:hypothetical protein
MQSWPLSEREDFAIEAPTQATIMVRESTTLAKRNRKFTSFQNSEIMIKNWRLDRSSIKVRISKNA